MRDEAFKPELKQDTLAQTDITPVVFLYKGTMYKVLETVTINGEKFLRSQELTTMEASHLIRIAAV